MNNISINKGVELMLRPRRKHPKPKSFFIKFGKMVPFFHREITIYFEFSLNIGNKRRGEKKWNY
jgi:hypothetical protein